MQRAVGRLAPARCRDINLVVRLRRFGRPVVRVNVAICSVADPHGRAVRPNAAWVFVAIGGQGGEVVLRSALSLSDAEGQHGARVGVDRPDRRSVRPDAGQRLRRNRIGRSRTGIGSDQTHVAVGVAN